MTPEQLREAMFSLNTRRMGTVAEEICARRYGLNPSHHRYHDLYDARSQQRVEVKFSTVLAALQPMDRRCILESISADMAANRRVSFEHHDHHTWDCNIQQVKPMEFDRLYYGLFFQDCVKIFLIGSSEIGKHMGFNDKQHKGNVGEGQFHVNDRNLDMHVTRYLHDSMTWNQLLDLLQPAATM
jgi:hypothetical protein